MNDGSSAQIHHNPPNSGISLAGESASQSVAHSQISDKASYHMIFTGSLNCADTGQKAN